LIRAHESTSEERGYYRAENHVFSVLAAPLLAASILDRIHFHRAIREEAPFAARHERVAPRAIRYCDA
jgi:hypothetical protein